MPRKFDVSQVGVNVVQGIGLGGPYIDVTVKNGSCEDIGWVRVGVRVGDTSHYGGYGDATPWSHTSWWWGRDVAFKSGFVPGEVKSERIWFAAGARLPNAVSASYLSGRARDSGIDFSTQDPAGFSSSDLTSENSDADARRSSWCFVTTVAFGDAKHPMVEEFRFLRDKMLVRYGTGRRLIKWYNRRGPAIARAIDRRPLARLMVRTALRPVAVGIRAARAVAGRLQG